MRKDKNKAFDLRRKGQSYREIQEELHISRSTLCEWFKNEEWSKHVKKINSTKTVFLSKERLQKLNKARIEKLDSYYSLAEKEATQEYERFKNDSLFMSGLMIYAGEGNKTNKHQIRISNSEFYLHKIFITFAVKYLNLKRENIKFWLLIYPDLNENESVDRWQIELGIPKTNFHKTQVIQGKEKVRRLQFGVGTVIISNTFLKKKIMKWLAICKENA